MKFATAYRKISNHLGKSKTGDPILGMYRPVWRLREKALRGTYGLKDTKSPCLQVPELWVVVGALLPKVLIDNREAPQEIDLDKETLQEYRRCDDWEIGEI